MRASLELGCGTGALWQGCSEAVRRCARLCLTDLSEGMLEKVRETVWEQKNVEYRIVDAIDLPYADSSFDLVFAHMMLYHVPDLGRALASFGVQDSLNRNFTLQNGGPRCAGGFQR